MSQVLDEPFIKMRENKINEEAINEDVVLKCANRAFEIANLPNEDNKLLIVEFISKIDKIDYKMNRELILKLFENLYLIGSLDEISLLEKDSKLLLTNYYIATTAKNAISYNDDFSYEERLKLLDFLSSFTNLFYKLNSVTNDTESVSALLTSSYDKTRKGIKEIVLKNK